MRTLNMILNMVIFTVLVTLELLVVAVIGGPPPTPPEGERWLRMSQRKVIPISPPLGRG